MEWHKGIYQFFDVTLWSHEFTNCFPISDDKKFALIYVDDILIFSHNFDEFLNHLNQIFERLR